MYGGHVVEDWDRRLTSAYLQTLFQEGLLEGNHLFPQFDFRAPTSLLNHKQVLFLFHTFLPLKFMNRLYMHCDCHINFEVQSGTLTLNFTDCQGR